MRAVYNKIYYKGTQYFNMCTYNSQLTDNCKNMRLQHRTCSGSDPYRHFSIDSRRKMPSKIA